MPTLESLTLKSCRERLLELGKRNRLYNYEEGERHLPILSPSIDSLYRLFVDGTKVYIYDLDAALARRNESATSFLDKEDLSVKEEIEASAKENELFLAPTRTKKLSRMIKNLHSFAKSSLEERGINTLYIALGFLEWKEGDEKETPLRSPILLLPVTLIKEGTRFAIKALEGETPRKNTTLALALKNQYSLDLPSMENKEKIASYFKRLEEYFSPQEGWKVEDDMSLGLFSFAKLDSYEDLLENEEVILSSPLVQQLFSPGAIHVSSKNKKDRGELPLVLSADASQREALRAFKRGDTFVLDGPPGTGKSQTIANLIALGLLEGKRILFVSEKKAALDVVYDKLEKTGLGSFCLNLHGSNASRGEVYRDLKKTIDTAIKVSENLDQTPEKTLIKARKKLLDYDSKLHAPYGPLGDSPYHVFASAIQYSNAPKVNFYFKDLSAYPYSRFQSCLRLLQELEAHFERFGRDIEEQGYYGYRKAYSYEEKLSLEKDLDTAGALTDILLDLAEEYPVLPLKNLPISRLPTYLLELKNISELPVLDPSYFDVKKKDAIQASYEDLLAARKKEEASLKSLLEIVKELPDDAQKEHLSALQNHKSCFRFLSKKYRAHKAAIKPLFKRKPRYVDFLDAHSRLERYEDSLEKHRYAKTSLAAFCGSFEDEEAVLSSLEFTKSLENEFPYLALDIHLPEEVVSFLEERGFDYQAFDSYVALSDRFDPLKKDIAFFDLGDMEDQVLDMRRLLPSLSDYLEFMRAFEEASKEGIGEFVEEYRQSASPIYEMKRAFMRVYYSQWGEKILVAYPNLQDFYRSGALENYSQAVEDIFPYHQEQIVTALARLIPKRSEEGEGASSRLGALYRLVSKKKLLPSIRSTLEQYFEELRYVKPVFLMSPLSVSTYLSSAAHFDVVIFDEASQVFPYDAIGALYRADQAVISGDDKQMPPSHYFQSGYVEEEDPSDLGGYESVLDYFASYPHYRLLYHYRSKNESLISFSSRVFYDDALVSFPSPEGKEGSSGVKFHYVPDGVYLRKGNKNLVEAKEVAKLALGHFKENPEDSLGIVAFSLSQQDAIDDALDELRAKDEAFSAWLEGAKEPFFLKNLESVQGDERDHIILSLGYGYDKDGKFLHAFGPLNVEGGERRLNVAISRARKALTFVASIHSFDIDPDRCSGEGPRILRDYLAFAESGILPEGYLEEPNPLDNPVLMDLEDALKERGYESVPYVGSSSFRVDLAVKDKETGRYVLGILDDAENYRLDLAPYDRDLLRPEMLEAQGWKVYRLSTASYFHNREEVLDDIINALQREIPEEEAIPLEETPEEEVAVSVSFPPFIPADLSLYAPKNGEMVSDVLPLLKKAVPGIIRAEQPITKKRLLSLCALLCNRKKVTKRIEADVETILSTIKSLRYDEDALTVMPYPKNAMMRLEAKRDFEEIPLCELASGLKELIRAYDRFDQQSLFLMVAKFFGYARVGKAMEARLESALKILLDERSVYIDFRGFYAIEGE